MRINALLPHTCRVVVVYFIIINISAHNTTTRYTATTNAAADAAVVVCCCCCCCFFVCCCCSFSGILFFHPVRHFQLLPNRPQPQCIILNAKFTRFWLQHEAHYIQPSLRELPRQRHTLPMIYSKSDRIATHKVPRVTNIYCI